MKGSSISLEYTDRAPKLQDAFTAYSAAVLMPYSLHAAAMSDVYALRVPLIAPSVRLYAELHTKCGCDWRTKRNWHTKRRAAHQMKLATTKTI
jgi:hypothetical protein